MLLPMHSARPTRVLDKTAVGVTCNRAFSLSGRLTMRPFRHAVSSFAILILATSALGACSSSSGKPNVIDGGTGGSTGSDAATDAPKDTPASTDTQVSDAGFDYGFADGATSPANIVLTIAALAGGTFPDREHLRRCQHLTGDELDRRSRRHDELRSGADRYLPECGALGDLGHPVDGDVASGGVAERCDADQPAGAKQLHKIEFFGPALCYRGPCPMGATHTYVFEVTAVPTATLTLGPAPRPRRFAPSSRTSGSGTAIVERHVQRVAAAAAARRRGRAADNSRARPREDRDMHYRKLGNSGLIVSSLSLGTMQFGRAMNMGALDQAQTSAMVRFALDQGINLIDTADVYSLGESETLLGHALRDVRDRVVLATKARLPMGDGDVNHSGATRKNILRECEASLRRLQTDYIDLYQIHGWDSLTPLEETLRALDDLVRAGKVRYIGLSNLPGVAGGDRARHASSAST